MEQIVEIPVSRGFGGGLQDFRPGQGPTASSDFLAFSSVSPGHPGAGVFRTFPQNKKVRIHPPVRVQICWGRLAHGRRRLMAPPWWLSL